MKFALVLSSLSVFLCSPVQAEWMLDNDASRINFVSTKANTAAEIHTFATLDGAVDDDGNATFSIDLDSVDTAIEIRDERMRSMLFDTENHPTATVTAKIDMDALDALGSGESADMSAEGQLSIHGTTTSVTLDLSVSRLSDDRVLVASRSPVIVNASQVGLLAGVEALREIAGLPSISPAVPVSFVLTFERED